MFHPELNGLCGFLQAHYAACLSSALLLVSIMFPVLMLFLIPIGGGIPAGVLLAQTKGLAWPVTAGLYLVSDVMLALAT